METQTSDTKFTSTVNKLFAPRQALQYIEPIDYPVTSRRTAEVEPIGELTSLLKEYHDNTKSHDTSNVDQKNAERAKKEKQEERKRFIQEKFTQWNPEEDKHISGDPYRTVFIGRLDYSIDEVELSNLFTNYGEIEKIRVVRDKDTSESKGYGFILFKNEADARLAYQRGNGMPIKERKCIVDMERGRSVKNWKPRWLGGGLGGRDYSKGKTAKSRSFRPHNTSASASVTAAANTSTNSFEKQQEQLKKELEEDSYEPAQGRNQMFAPPSSYNRGGANSGRGGRERHRDSQYRSRPYPSQQQHPEQAGYSGYRPRYANNTNSTGNGNGGYSGYGNNRRY